MTATTMTPTVPLLAEQNEQGRQRFAICFRRWVEKNGWNYSALTEFSKAVLGVDWLHRSQVSFLKNNADADGRRRALINPNPRVFYAIWRVNNALHQWKTTGERPPLHAGLKARHYENAEVWMDGEGQPISLERLHLLFLGQWIPPDYLEPGISTQQANEASRKLAILVQTHMLVNKGELVMTGLDSFMAGYEPEDEERRSRLRATIAAVEGAGYTPAQLLVELQDIATALTAYTGDPWSVGILREHLGLKITP